MMQGTHYYPSSINGPAAGIPYSAIKILLINALHSWSCEELLAGRRWYGFAVTARIISGS